MKRFALCLLLMSCPPAAVTPVTSAPPPPSPEEVERTELEAMLLSIPPACSASEPLETIACPAKPSEPPNACVVERRDTKSKRLTDRLVYAGKQLISVEEIVSSHTTTLTTLTSDEQSRVIEKTTCFSAGKGEPEWFPTWRPPMAVYDAPYLGVSRARITYDGDSQRPRFAQIDSTAGEASSRMKLCYAYDENARRARRIQVIRDRTAASLQVQARKYAWSDQRLASIDFRNVSLKDRSIASKNQYRVAFAYDASGKLIDETMTAPRQPPFTVHYTYDERGRLSAYASITFDWDEKGRLTGMHPEDPALDGKFEWDASGRIIGATFKNGEGYSVTYSRTCEPGFSPTLVTPSVDGYLFYEGKDEL